MLRAVSAASASVPSSILGLSPSQKYLNILTLGVLTNSATDQRVAIQAADASANAAGMGLYFPPGFYCYGGGPSANSGAIQATVPWIGSNYNLSELRNISTQLPNNGTGTTGGGGNAQITWTGITGMGLQDLVFTAPTTTPASTNPGYNSWAGSDGCVAIYSCTRFTWKNVDFQGVIASAAFVNSTYGDVTNCRTFDTHHDSFYVTGLSSDITFNNCAVTNGGDDGFPVQGSAGYGAAGSGTDGIPIRIRHIGCRVNGIRNGRGFAYIGTQSCQNDGCFFDGVIPGYATQYQSACALLIYVDTNAGTWGNTDLTVTNFTATNSGRGGSPFTNVYQAIQIQGSVPQTIASVLTPIPSSNIRLNNIQLYNCASGGIFISGQGYDSGTNTYSMTDVICTNVVIDNTSDPNGYTATAGTATFPAITVEGCNNVEIQATVRNIGGEAFVMDDGGTAQTYNYGTNVLDGRIYTMNVGNKATFCRAYACQGTKIARARARIYIAKQPSASIGSQYGLSNTIQIGTYGIFESISLECDPSVTALGGGISISSSGNFPSIPASGSSYANPSNFPLLCEIDGGAAVTFNRGQGTNVGASIPGPRQLTLGVGESLKFTYTTVPTQFKTWPAANF